MKEAKKGAIYTEDRVEALIFIALKWSEVDRESAVQVLEEALKIVRGSDSGNICLMLDVAKVLLEVNSERAIQVLDEVLEDGTSSTFAQVVPILAKVDLERALQIAEEIEDDDYRAEALCKITGSMVKVDLDRALKIAREIEEDWVRAEALTHVAIEQAKSDPDVALKLLDEAILELKDKDECYFEDVRVLERIAMQLRMLA